MATKTNSNIFKRLTKQAISNLNLIGAQYKIILSDGTEIGGLKLAKTPRSNITNHGQKEHDYKAVYVDRLNTMKTGDLIELEYEDHGFKPEKARICIVGMANVRFGMKSITTSINHKTKRIEVLRVK